MATRLINAHRTEIQTSTSAELKQSIWDSEGRVILAQNFVAITIKGRAKTWERMAVSRR